jgi:hypothetical protein
LRGLRNATTLRQNGSPPGASGIDAKGDEIAMTALPPTDVVSPELALVDPELRRATVGREPAPHHATEPARPSPAEAPVRAPAKAPRRRISVLTAALLLLGGAAAGVVASVAGLRKDSTTTTSLTTTTLATTTLTTTAPTAPPVVPRPSAGSGYLAAGGLRFRVGKGASVVSEVSVPLHCAPQPAALPPIPVSSDLSFSFNGNVRERRRNVHLRLAGKFVDSGIATVAVSESARGCVESTRIYIARLS